MILLLSGLGDKELAGTLGLAPLTVHTFVGRARRKLRQRTRAAAAVTFALLTLNTRCQPGLCPGLASRLASA
jgi:DNA-binding CsgD family transcriptional regulator